MVEDDEAVADYVRGFIDRNGLDSVGRLALSIESDAAPDREAMAAGLGDVVVVEDRAGGRTGLTGLSAGGFGRSGRGASLPTPGVHRV